jgi:acetyl-CoA synthetase
VAILNSENSLANIDEIGEISVKRKNAWFRVKDFGYKDDEGYFFHAGRSDDVIISAGWTMSAVEIENTLLTHPSVAEAAVIGVADSLRGQVARAYIVLNTDALAQTDVIKAYMKEKLSQHEYPREINFVKTLPKTPAGKVNRKALRDKAKSTNSS